MAHLRLGLAQGLCVSTAMYPVSRWRTTVTKQLKRIFQRRTTMVVRIDLRRIRWIEPIRESGEWWPLPLKKRR